MIYFHVLLAMAQEPERHRCVFHDLTERQLRDQVLKPFKRGKNLLCGNQIYPLADVRRIHIVSTEGTASHALAAVNQASNETWKQMNNASTGVVFVGPGLIFGLDNLDRVGKEVTGRFIKEPFSQAPVDGPFHSLFKNPWVVGIGTALAATGIGVWLKWN